MSVLLSPRSRSRLGWSPGNGSPRRLSFRCHLLQRPPRGQTRELPLPRRDAPATAGQPGLKPASGAFLH